MRQTLLVVFSLSLSAQVYISDPRWRVVGAGPADKRPAACTRNRDVWICNGPGCGAYGFTVYYCTAQNTWTELGATAHPVLSVFGRVGAVTAQPGDYSFSQISGTAAKTQLPATTVHTDQSNIWTAGTQDFSGAGATKPAKAGTALPGSCSVGELFFRTDAMPGANLYGCTAQNTWSQIGPGDITAVGNCTSGDCFQNVSANTVLAGPVSGSGQATMRTLTQSDIPALDASKITTGTFADARIAQSSVTQHQAALQLSGSQIVSGTIAEARIDSAITRDSEINVQGTANEIASSGSGPTPVLSIASTFRIKNKSATGPVKTGTTVPSTCEVGDLFFKSDATPGANLYGCTATNTWTLLGGAGGSSTFLGLSDTPSSYSGQGGRIVAVRSDETGLEFQSPAWLTGSGTAGTLAIWTSDGSLSDSAVSEDSQYVTSAKEIRAPRFSTTNEPPDTHVLRAVGGGSITIAPANTTSEHTITLPAQTGTVSLDGHGHSVGGDLSGALGSATVVGLQGRAVASTAPSDGQVLMWNATASQWTPQSLSAEPFDPMQESIYWFREEFISANTSSGQIGTHGWTSSCSAGTISKSNTGGAISRHALRMQTAATSGSICQISLGSVGSPTAALGRLTEYSGWKLMWRFALLDTSDVFFFVGVIQGGNSIDGAVAKIGLEYDTGSGDNQFYFRVGSNRIATGIGVDSAIRTLVISSSSAGSITLQLGSSTETVPYTSSASLSPIIGVKALAASAKRTDAVRMFFSGPYLE